MIPESSRQHCVYRDLFQPAAAAGISPTTSLIETWIDENERRSRFLAEIITES